MGWADLGPGVVYVQDCFSAGSGLCVTRRNEGAGHSVVRTVIFLHTIEMTFSGVKKFLVSCQDSAILGQPA